MEGGRSRGELSPRSVRATAFIAERRLFSQCAVYKKVGLTAGFDPNGGGFAEYVRAMPWIVEHGMVEIPADVAFEEATFVEPVNTCLKAVQKARVAAGETVLVMGQGPIGLLLMMLARLAGATVFTSDPMPERRAVSERLGAAAAFDPARGHLTDEIRARTEGRGADAVLVAAPMPALLGEGLSAARPGGRVLLFAQNDPHMKIEFPAAGRGCRGKRNSGQLQRRRGPAGGVRASGLFACTSGGGVDHAPVSTGSSSGRLCPWQRGQRVTR